MNQVQAQTEWTVVKTKKQAKALAVQEDIPNEAVDILVREFLSLVGNHDWNDPLNVSKTIAEMMTIDLTKDSNQVPVPSEIDRTIFIPNNKENNKPFWICQSIIRVDEKFNKRYVEYKGAKYNKIDIIFKNEYFKERMNAVAKAAHCTWNARWGNSTKEEHRLYQKTRPGSKSTESWLERSIRHLLTDEDTNGINIKNLVMIEFKRTFENLE